MTAEELINKLQTMIDNDTMLATTEVKVLHPEFDIITGMKVCHSVTPDLNTIYLQLI